MKTSTFRLLLAAQFVSVAFATPALANGGGLAYGVNRGTASTTSATTANVSTHAAHSNLGASHLVTVPYQCSRDNGAVARFINQGHRIEGSLTTRDDLGFTGTQAGLVVHGIVRTIPLTQISFRYKPLNRTTPNCLTGPFIFDRGISPEFGNVTQLINVDVAAIPGNGGSITGPSADGFFTVTLSQASIEPGFVVSQLGFLTTNDGSYLIDSLVVDNHPISPDLSAHLGVNACPFPTSFAGFDPCLDIVDYCGSDAPPCI